MKFYVIPNECEESTKCKKHNEMFDYIFYKLVDFSEYITPALDFTRQNYSGGRGGITICWLGNYATILLFFRDNELWLSLFQIGAFVLVILPMLIYPNRRGKKIIEKFDAMPNERLKSKKTAAIIYVIATIVMPIIIFRATR